MTTTQSSGAGTTGKTGELLARVAQVIEHLEAVPGAGSQAGIELAAAGTLLRGTPWGSFRGGRQRIGALAAAYRRWLAPPADWRLTNVDGRTLTWENGNAARGAALTDILSLYRAGEEHGAGDTRLARRLLQAPRPDGCPGSGDRVIRICVLDAPRCSWHLTDQMPEALEDSPWAFGWAGKAAS